MDIEALGSFLLGVLVFTLVGLGVYGLLVAVHGKPDRSALTKILFVLTLGFLFPGASSFLQLIVWAVFVLLAGFGWFRHIHRHRDDSKAAYRS